MRAAVTGRTVAPAPRIPAPPFWGSRAIGYMPLEIVFQHLHKPELYRLSWGAKNAHGDEWTKLEAEFEDRLYRMQKAAIKDKTLRPQGVYGYFPAAADGDDLVIYDPAPFSAANGHINGHSNGNTNGSGPARVEIARFAFPRQPDGEFLCISDYFATVESGLIDVCTLQVVTVGEVASEAFEVLQSADNYSEAYFFHGLAVQTAEATANYVTKHARRELGLAEGQGKRYSWGYPACPDLEDHAQVFRLLPQAEAEIGLTLTASYQLVPEQSTAAIFAHHPDAKYFSVGNLDRVAQILGAG
jgi:5-methyltetrahydrofolate--homocysteine methyltransferase